MYNLSNGTILAQEIVASSVLSVIEILTIKDHKIDNIFLYVAFRSDSLLKPTSDKTGSDIN
jgi:hypothetical protein